MKIKLFSYFFSIIFVLKSFFSTSFRFVLWFISNYAIRFECILHIETVRITKPNRTGPFKLTRVDSGQWIINSILVQKRMIDRCMRKVAFNIFFHLCNVTSQLFMLRNKETFSFFMYIKHYIVKYEIDSYFSLKKIIQIYKVNIVFNYVIVSSRF